MSKYQFALFGDCEKDSDVEWGKKKAMGNSQNRVDFILVYWSKSDDQDYYYDYYDYYYADYYVDYDDYFTMNYDDNYDIKAET